MPPIIALILCVVLVTVLLYVERRRNPDASIALWIPTLWMLIYGSRPIGRWFQHSQIATMADVVNIEVGSPLDRWVLSILIIFSLVTLFRRKIDWAHILKDNFWLILLYLYLGISILWSDIPFVSFKRWSRSTGDILMALVVLSEQMPLQALESVIRRCAYVLIPFSIVLIKYYPYLGVGYGRWSGLKMWTGVTVHKNTLGILCALSAFFLIWALHREWQSGNLFKTKSQTFVDLFVLAIALFLLIGPGGNSFSATSVAMLIVGISILLLLSRMKSLTTFMAKHLKAFMISSVLIFILLYDSVIQMVTSILGRDITLTGRTDIWRPLFDYASRNPIFGVGYGGFFAPDNNALEHEFGAQFIITQAHNGYLAIYVELGIIGILMLGLFLLNYCGKARREFNHSFEWGVYGICFLFMALLYNNSEIGFLQSQSYLWSTMVFLTVVFSTSRLQNGD
jgi:exopolysaccharide production protein ExoQ